MQQAHGLQSVLILLGLLSEGCMLAWHRILILLLSRCGVTTQDCEVQQTTQSQGGAAMPRRGAAYAARLQSSQRLP